MPVRDCEPCKALWRAHLLLILGLLGFWFLASFLGSQVFHQQLNRIAFWGTPLGQWFVQNGMFYLFVLESAYYLWQTRRLDQKYSLDRVH